MSELNSENFLKTVQSPFTGQEYVIRRIDLLDFMVEVGVLPVALSESVSDKLARLGDELRAKSGDPEFEQKMSQYFIEKGVREPKVWFGADGECPNGQVCYADLGTDRRFLTTQVSDFSFGFAFIRDREKFFRGAGAAGIGPDGQEVRAEAVEPAADGNGGGDGAPVV